MTSFGGESWYRSPAWIVVSIPGVAREAGVTWPTAKAALERLRGLRIAAESTGRQRDRLYTYTRQLAILNQGTGG